MTAVHTYLVTGAGDGIGKATAIALARAGVTVVLLGKTIKKLEATYDEIISSGAPTPAIYPMDLKGITWADASTLAEKLQTEFGRLDGFIHCAATLGHLCPIEHYSPEVWHHVIQVNLNAAFLLTRALLPSLKASSNSNIVFVNDAVAEKPKAYFGAYAVSKAGLLALTRTLQEELESHPTLTVAHFEAPPTKTQLRANAYPAENKNHLHAPEQVAQNILKDLLVDVA